MRKGQRASEEQKRKQSEAMKGKMPGEKNPKWKGGVRRGNGYIQVYRPDHPYPTSICYVPLQRLVVEGIIGRLLLPGEEVHHIDKNKINNDPRNLIAFSSKSAHMRNEHSNGKSQCTKQEIIFDGRLYC